MSILLQRWITFLGLGASYLIQLHFVPAAALNVAANVHPFTVLSFAVLFILIGIALEIKKWPGGRVIVSIGFFVSAAMLLYTSVPIAVLCIMIFATVLALLITARVGLIWFVLLCGLAGGIVGHATRDWELAAAGALASGLLFVAINYLVQLVTDHTNERAQLIKHRRDISPKVIATSLAFYWLPTVALVALGMWVNNSIQIFGIQKVYDAQIVRKKPVEAGAKAPTLEDSVIYTLEQHRAEKQKEFLQKLSESSASAANASKVFPGVVAEQMELLRPGLIDTGRCSGAKAKVWKFHIPLGWLCVMALDAANDGIQTSFVNAKAKAVARATEKAAKFSKVQTVAAEEARKAGPELVDVFFDELTTSARYTFLIFNTLALVSYVFLAGGILGALNLTLGRILFDHTLSPRKGRKSALAFRLSDSAQPAKRLNFKSYHQVPLSAYAIPSKGNVDWYVAFQAMRAGPGTHMRTSAPCPASLLFSRVIARRYLMTKITVEPNYPNNNGPIISSPGDLKLILIELVDGQEVVFRVPDLLAFTSETTLGSTYTAHIATHLLGLGSFFATAKGPGCIVLCSEGQQVHGLSNGTSVPAESLLCWDRRTEFTLGQELTVRGMWLNDPSVVGNSVADAAILDEGRASGTGLFRRIVKVVRYFFLPF
ncbi:hypothetical protein [Bosea sp. UC22_33]|uniref:hypothetical protein n=1 Tax=Bosea sp. UC22_33 TaxID=3350165 RepID=UPI00366BBBEE